MHDNRTTLRNSKPSPLPKPGTHETEQAADLRKEVSRLLSRARQGKRATICMVCEAEPRSYPGTTWWSVYVVKGGELVKLWYPPAMKLRRADGNYYWTGEGWGTSHAFLAAESVGQAAGVNPCHFANAVHRQIL